MNAIGPFGTALEPCTPYSPTLLASERYEIIQTNSQYNLYTFLSGKLIKLSSVS